MPFVYILENSEGRHYVGMTNLNLFERLARHNKGDVYSTKFHRPWSIVLTEEYQTLEEARIRERQIKSWKGGNGLKKLLSKTAGSSNGRTLPFGGRYRGSNPSPAVLERSNKFGGVK